MQVTEIDALVLEGVPFDEIEDLIEETQQDADVKAALWLYAWVETDRADRQQAVREIVAARHLA
jgi:hypothetical protein